MCLPKKIQGTWLFDSSNLALFTVRNAFYKSHLSVNLTINLIILFPSDMTPNHCFRPKKYEVRYCYQLQIGVKFCTLEPSKTYLTDMYGILGHEFVRDTENYSVHYKNLI